MKVIFCGVFYYGGPVRHLYSIFQIYRQIAEVFEYVGINCRYFSKQNEVLPQEKTLSEEEFYKALPETDLLFMWNGGLGKEVQIAEKCWQLGIPVYFMELGWLPQTETFYFDRKGVNFASSLTDWQYAPLSTEDIKFVGSKLAFYQQRIVRLTGIKERDFVFVPFQVETDSQLKKYSQNIKNMQQLIDFVTSHIPGRIIFKKHPKDDPGELKFPPRCTIYDKGTTHDFLSQCRYVVTINSTVGVEALTYNKPVINLGQAFYEGRKMTYPVRNDSDMKAAIEWANGGKVAKDVIQAFLCYLFKKQWHKLELSRPEKVMTLISDLTK